MKLLLKISYIGTSYCGFQSQENGRSVQEVMTKASNEVFSEECNVTGCSRTDSGVHARGFCLTVEPKNKREDWCRIPVEKVHRAYTNVLPSDISVVAAAKVNDDFHPRYYALGKRYIYRIRDAAWHDPFEFERSMRCTFRITDEMLSNMQKAASYYIGKHDFASFMGSGSKITDSVRTVTEAKVERKGNIVEFSVSADGFLYNMVRIMAGTLMGVAEGKFSPEDIPNIIEAKDRKKAGVTAVPYGLYLDEVFYEEEPDWHCI